MLLLAIVATIILTTKKQILSSVNHKDEGWRKEQLN